MNRTVPASLQRLDRPRRRRRLAAGLLALGTAASVSAIAAPADAAPIAPTVVERYAPMVFLYSSDDNRPTTAERFVDNSRLRWNHDQDCPDDDVTDEPRASTLGNGGYRHRTAGTWPICSPGDTVYRSNQFTRPYSGIAGDEGFFLDLRDEFRGGIGRRARVYYRFSPGSFVTYWMFYAFNDAPPGGSSPSDHEGDWERISVRLNANNQATNVAYFGHGDYCTLPWADVNTSNGHPVVYSANGSHASYPTEEADGLGPDQADKGPRWNTWRRLRSLTARPWFNYGGGWGVVNLDNILGSDSTGPVGPRFQSDTPAPSDWSHNPC
jgi:hypothetical protein